MRISSDEAEVALDHRGRWRMGCPLFMWVEIEGLDHAAMITARELLQRAEPHSLAYALRDGISRRPSHYEPSADIVERPRSTRHPTARRRTGPNSCRSSASSGFG